MQGRIIGSTAIIRHQRGKHCRARRGAEQRGRITDPGIAALDSSARRTIDRDDITSSVSDDDHWPVVPARCATRHPGPHKAPCSPHPAARLSIFRSRQRTLRPNRYSSASWPSSTQGLDFTGCRSIAHRDSAFTLVGANADYLCELRFLMFY